MKNNNIIIQWNIDDGTMRTKTHFIDILEKACISFNWRFVFNKTNKKVTLSDSEYLGIFNNIYEPQRELIKSVAEDNFIEMRNSGKDLLATGEAAFIFKGERFGADEELGKKIQKMAEEADVDTIITLSAKAKNNIEKVSNLKVSDISEFVSELI